MKTQSKIEAAAEELSCRLEVHLSYEELLEVLTLHFPEPEPSAIIAQGNQLANAAAILFATTARWDKEGLASSLSADRALVKMELEEWRKVTRGKQPVDHHLGETDLPEPCHVCKQVGKHEMWCSAGARSTEPQPQESRTAEDVTKTWNGEEEYGEALREIVMLCGHGDPSDGEGTSGPEVVDMVKQIISTSKREGRIEQARNSSSELLKIHGADFQTLKLVAEHLESLALELEGKKEV